MLRRDKLATSVQFERIHCGKSNADIATLDVFIYGEVYHEDTDIELCQGMLGRYPEPRSVVVIDKASFHFISQNYKGKFPVAGVIAGKQPSVSLTCQ
jgi:hypothetical protein